MPNIVILSNLQTTMVFVFNLFMKFMLVIAGSLYIADNWNSSGVAILAVLAYLVSEGFLFYLGDEQDVVYLTKIEETEDAGDEENR